MARVNNIVSIYDVVADALDIAATFGQREGIANFKQIALDTVIQSSETTAIDQKEIDKQRYRRIYSYKRNRPRLG